MSACSHLNQIKTTDTSIRVCKSALNEATHGYISDSASNAAT